jgi:hypothetical protein
LRAIAVILGVERDSARVPVWSLVSPLMLYMFSSLLVGEVGAAVLLWICVLAVAVLLGYRIRLHASISIIVSTTHITSTILNTYHFLLTQ